MTNEAAPCSCGSTDVRLVDLALNAPSPIWPHIWRVECFACGVYGYIRQEKEDAIASWEWFQKVGRHQEFKGRGRTVGEDDE